MGAPAWLHLALDELAAGVAELPDPAENPRIAEYLSVCGLPGDDEISWCAAFVAWDLLEAGQRANGVRGACKPNARSFLAYGERIEYRVGAIAVLWRESRASWKGHVGFVVGRTASQILLLGGNQSNRVSVATYPLQQVLGYRWPVI
jgi:uncharacterized protein (TIGR02594 family)